MTDQNQTPDLPTADDAFASLRAGRTSHPAMSVRTTDAYDGASVRLVNGGAVLDEGDSEVIAQERADNGATLSGALNDVSALSGRIGYLQGTLAEGAHDPRTGTFAHALTGTARASFEVELASLSEELTTAHATVQAVKARMARERHAEQVRVENDAAVTEFTNGDARREAALKDALLRKEAGVMAEWLLGCRYGV